MTRISNDPIKDHSREKKTLINNYKILKNNRESGKIHDKHRNIQIKIMVLMMGFIASVAACLIIMYTNLIRDTKEIQVEVIEKCRNEEFEYLWGVLNEKFSYSAKNNIMNASENIEESIRELDLEQLKAELDQGIYPEELNEIFEDNLKNLTLNGINNGRNNAMVVSNDHIIINYSYYAYPNEAEDSHLFSGIITSGYNKELSLNAIDHLYKQDESVVCIELQASDNPNHIKIKNASKESFREVYLKEGIEGFKNYQFLVPVYVTETGDIFGQSDIVQGDRIDKTHKFIIIQEFNLYDQLQLFPENLEEDNIAALQAKHEKLINNMYILGIIFVFLVFIILINFNLTYNNFIYGYMIALNEDNAKLNNNIDKK